MKKNVLKNIFILSFLAIICIHNASYAQPKKINLLREFVWGESDRYKELPPIPSKWNNESAVIIFNHQQHFYTKASKTLDNYFLNRKIIQLNDKASIEKFSEFNYPSTYVKKYRGVYKTINTWMGIKIIKADGTIKEIDVDNERILKSTNNNTFYYGFIRKTGYFEKSYKLAIPDLEIGDTIDYYFYTHEEYKTTGTHVMEAIESPIANSYPTMDFLLELKVENDFYINYNSFNGAPKLENITPEKSKEKFYRIRQKDIEKRESTRWFYPLMEDPAIKYQMGFAQRLGDIVHADAYLSQNQDIIKTKVTEEDLLKKHKSDIYTKVAYNGRTNSFLKENENLSKRELAEKMYYYMRHIFRNEHLERLIAYNKRLVQVNYAYLNIFFITSPEMFLQQYCTFLRRQEIPFELIKAKKRFDGSINDLLIKDNIVTFIKLNFEEPVYVFPFESNTFFNHFPALLEDTEAFRMIFEEGYYKIEAVGKLQLPKSTHEENKITEAYDIKLDEAFSMLNVVRTAQSIGHSKLKLFDTYLQWTDIINEENQKYGTTPFSELLNKKKSAAYQEKKSAFILKMNEEHQKGIEEEIKREFDFDLEDFSCKIIDTGRKALEEPMILEQKFVIKNDLIKRAGSNYIIEIGKLIGQQIATTKKEETRTENIYMAFPRTFENTISFEIPEGYTIVGIDKLNTSIDNETGGFSSEAKIKENKLVIKTVKHYKNNYEPNQNWKKMLDFLEAAYQFSQEKILLKKR